MGRRPVRVAAGLVLFVAVDTLNSGGYHYGASDQAFYIPAILDQLDPSRYPRDSALIGPLLSRPRLPRSQRARTVAFAIRPWRSRPWA